MKKVIENIYPLTPVQEGLLYHALIDRESRAYFLQRSCTIKGELHGEEFKRAWRDIVGVHAALRTAFNWEDRREPFQVVYRDVELKWYEGDWSNKSKSEQAEELERTLEADYKHGFDLKMAPLMRLGLMRLSEYEHKFIWSYHHLILDGWSVSMVLKDVFVRYERLVKGVDIKIKQEGLFWQYVIWLKKQDMKESEEYWRRRLEGISHSTSLGVEKTVTDGKRSSGRREVKLNEETVARLVNKAREHRVTVSTMIYGAWALVLSRYSGEREVVFGLTVSGRSIKFPDIEKIVGLLINTLPVRVEVAEEQRVSEWLKRLQEERIEMQQYEYASLVEILRLSDIKGRRGLFDNILTYENTPADVGIIGGKSELRVSDDRCKEETNYDLSLEVRPGREMKIIMVYDERKYEATVAVQILKHLEKVVYGLAMCGGEARMRDVEMLTDKEREQILTEWSGITQRCTIGKKTEVLIEGQVSQRPDEGKVIGKWNKTRREFNRDKCIHQLFEDQVELSPDAIAVIDADRLISYGQLNRRANRLAHRLRKLGVGPEDIIALVMDRSLEMIVSILGVLKAGAAYLPLDPTTPLERMKFMIEDSAAVVVISGGEVIEREMGRAMVIKPGKMDGEAEENAQVVMSTNNAAYVIYTSGSTGRPKGVAVSHQALANYLIWSAQTYGIAEGAVAPVHSPLSFDLTVTSLFPPLLVGGLIVLVPESEGVSGLARAFKTGRGYSLVKLTPSHLRLLNQMLSGSEANAARTLVIGGEALKYEDLAFWRRHAPQTRLINEYGPTEAVVGCCVYEASGWSGEVGAVPIGRPIANARMYVLDVGGAPSSIVVAGELYIGGAGLARGYMNQPDLTGERFVPDGLGPEVGERLYRTGDRARWLADGNLEFLGRLDGQVKVRGFRIELGEIESALTQHPTIRQAVVIAREDIPGDKRLVAYLLFNRNSTADTHQIRAYLQEKLPDYMLPSAFFELQQFPLTPNGKINWTSLPSLREMIGERKESYVAPSNWIEEKVAEIWAEVLGLERIGVNDNFFELGGHSLLAMKVMSRVREAFKCEIKLSNMVDIPTVSGQALAIMEKMTEASPDDLEYLQQITVG